ncbi:TetR/AcrR family transcriptional regulator [Paenibacillus sp. 481]|uniref:TetR/AcrR family transcriptional regulator n=1 Tax=Paenibacillus sp. 481 TaxID=2835869 RepID=UPI001E3F6715|nr:TetR/AcrR family transcriptional regulator [Paenibacillus sp. 481]UHA72469.1 TetR/AcrR family transcriptional regulator C-terminal domain-containing protein [Paenibacillus sp. 481]
MREKAEYRSAIRSRNMIRRALVELMLEKEFQKITIKDIVDRADVSRGTFYAHFSDVHAVIEQIEIEIMEKMIEFLDEFKHTDLIQNVMPFLVKVSHFLGQDIEFYRMLIKIDHACTFLTKVKVVFIKSLLSYERKMDTEQEREAFLLHVNFFASGLVAMYQDWFEGKIDGSLDDLAASVSRIMAQGFQPFLMK